MFQSTHPRGVRPDCVARYRDYYVFQSTHPRGVRPVFSSICRLSPGFNPRTHAGCDPDTKKSNSEDCGFNPRTHAGCDACFVFFSPSFQVSIHAPTRGATTGNLVSDHELVVSIHAPTRGATWHRAVFFGCIQSFNPRTHAGCDTGGSGFKPLMSVSIHAPTRGATGLAFQITRSLWFQSTHPRGVRRN